MHCCRSLEWVLFAAALGSGSLPWPPSRPTPLMLPVNRVLSLPDPRADLAAVLRTVPDSTRVVLGTGTFRVGAPGIRLERKRGLVIEGQGAGLTTITLDPAVRLGVDIGDSVTGLTLQRLTLRATRGEQPHTQAFGSTSGRRGIHGIIVRDIEVRDLGLGISVGAGLTGEYDSVLIERNVLRNMVGLGSGSGYGIHNDNASHVIIRDNEIRDAQRHSIYQSRGSQDIRIERNLIVNHGRRRRPANPEVAALAVARSSNVTVAGNLILDPYAVAISLEYDDVHGFPITGLALVDNIVIGWRQPALWLNVDGEIRSCGNRFVRPSAAPGEALRRGMHAGPETLRRDGPACPPAASRPNEPISVAFGSRLYSFDGRCIVEAGVRPHRPCRIACFRG